MSGSHRGERMRLGPGRRGVVALLASVLVAAVAAACGVPSDGEPRRIEADELPSGLVEPAGSTTSSTVSGSSEVVQLYYVVDGELAPAIAELAEPVALRDVIGALVAGPNEVFADAGFRSALTSGTDVVLDTAVRRGVAYIDLSPEFQEIGRADQVLALGQIVFTATARPGVGQVQFTIDGQRIPVPRADGDVAPGPLSRDDYASLRKAE